MLLDGRPDLKHGIRSMLAGAGAPATVLQQGSRLPGPARSAAGLDRHSGVEAHRHDHRHYFAHQSSKGTITMAQFIYLYRGPATPMTDMTPEQGAERMVSFGAWMEKVAVVLIDVGSPFGECGISTR